MIAPRTPGRPASGGETTAQAAPRSLGTPGTYLAVSIRALRSLAADLPILVSAVNCGRLSRD